ncbi:hypothetical protein MTR_4g025720 [Medicago truncatula]|uniref:Uncharacterized protein n=1 Tax=Medicago truncatula TaxID=3880 RepID=A0A072UH87_MEDTR|nr:hypothetical protein MTR_4g025720 [Medicago truncatula]
MQREKLGFTSRYYSIVTISTIPEDGRRKAYAEILEKAKAKEEERVEAEKEREAAATTKKMEEEALKLSKQEAQASNLAKEDQEKAEATDTSVEDILNKAKAFVQGFKAKVKPTGCSWQKFNSKVATAIQKPDEDENPKVQVATVLETTCHVWKQRPTFAEDVPEASHRKKMCHDEIATCHVGALEANNRNIFLGADLFQIINDTFTINIDLVSE